MIRGFFIGFILLVLITSTSFKERFYDPRIIYVFDPLCGWCFGFNDELKKVISAFEGRFRPEVYCGGLAIGDKVQLISEKADYIREALPYIEKKTSVLFGHGFKNKILESKTYLYSSEPASVALLVIRELRPDVAMEYSHKIQHAFFYDGISLNDTSTFLNMNQEFSIPDTSFLKEFRRVGHYHKKLMDELSTIEAWGVQGFPTVLVESEEGDRQIVSTGFVDSETIIKRIRKTMK